MTDYMKKVVMLGDPSVGKTSLVARFVKDMFDDKYLSTLGAKPSKKILSVGEDNIILMVWDIAGHNHTLHPTYYSGAKAALIVCDVTRHKTVDSLNTWRSSLIDTVGEIPIIALINKTDLTEWKFKQQDVESMGFITMLTSAKTGDNVELAFQKLTEMMLDGQG